MTCCGCPIFEMVLVCTSKINWIVEMGWRWGDIIWVYLSSHCSIRTLGFIFSLLPIVNPMALGFLFSLLPILNLCTWPSAYNCLAMLILITLLAEKECILPFGILIHNYFELHHLLVIHSHRMTERMLPYQLPLTYIVGWCWLFPASSLLHYTVYWNGLGTVLPISFL